MASWACEPLAAATSQKIGTKQAQNGPKRGETSDFARFLSISRSPRSCSGNPPLTCSGFSKLSPSERSKGSRLHAVALLRRFLGTIPRSRVRISSESTQKHPNTILFPLEIHLLFMDFLASQPPNACPPIPCEARERPIRPHPHLRLPGSHSSKSSEY